MATASTMIHDNEEMQLSLILCQLNLLRFTPLNSVKNAGVICDWVAALLSMAASFNDADKWSIATTEVRYYVR
jgi:hypothetical protein